MGDSFVVDIREGEQTEIVFSFTGTPPFAFTYSRRAPQDRSKDRTVLETHTVTFVPSTSFDLASCLAHALCLSQRYSGAPVLHLYVAGGHVECLVHRRRLLLLSSDIFSRLPCQKSLKHPSASSRYPSQSHGFSPLEQRSGEPRTIGLPERDSKARPSATPLPVRLLPCLRRARGAR